MQSFLKNISKHQYPSLEELAKILKAPNLHRFGFKNQWNTGELPEKLIDGKLVEYNRADHLYEWDKLLGNKIVDLQTAYVYVLVHASRGIPRTAQEYINNVDIRANYDNLRFYLTYLHYIVISIVDNILQIINVFFELNLSENKVFKDKIIRKLKQFGYQTVVDSIEKFFNDFNKFSDHRNAIAHRFSPYDIDRRAEVVENTTNNTIILGFNNDFCDFESEITNVEKSFDLLRSYITQLRHEMNLS